MNDVVASGQGGDENIGHIKRQQIFDCWAEGMTLGQIAEETKLSVGVVKRILKDMQKELVARGGGGHDQRGGF
jgi:DNA-binding CsgD family transcriptional regulator